MNDPGPGTHDGVKSLKCLLMYVARDIKNTPPPIGLHVLWGLTVSLLFPRLDLWEFRLKITASRLTGKCMRSYATFNSEMNSFCDSKAIS